MFSECGGWNCLNSGDMASKRGDDGYHHGLNKRLQLSGEHKCETAWPDRTDLAMQGHFLMLPPCPCMAIIAI